MAAAATTSHTLSTLLGQMALFSGLSADEQNALALRCRRRRFPAHSALFHEGDPGQTLYLIVSGWVNIEKAGDTSRVHIARRGPGEHFGEMALFDNQPRSADAVAATECDLLILNRADVSALLENNASVAWALTRTLAARLREAADAAVQSGTLDVTGRLAALLLCEIGEKSPDATGGYALARITEEQIAARIGASRESVSRSLSRLRQMGAVRRDGRILVVVNPARLHPLCTAPGLAPPASLR